ncbi:MULTISPECIES: cadmium resistance transporter [unclassified Mycolicibacterium]|uniref:cadmium resistance transporter n=1 Tax=unclassified Mycolicibacterium TaxID=2636767 RepID=UPI0012DEE758|nr:MULTISPECIES: cadmium resistance transporter [unclassified Mycolicibacterium]MUL85689.1 cadmium transporter [Mycolicibacterium sp. CBMA 329]MUL91566.1 cadmium transporter [Mycolicibacterium sp. CBMA 331]MUM02194.1 cadmium transporter [Mycolicibacterium sp. CBMA 334]MUM28025.1 cadmium transporter [Mycolicibacterium sp. CBMA 295]MUM41144.1 cadmium transporter [Mycolicibacterium sp. CBMA 247]
MLGHPIASTAVTAMAMFAATNIDDAVVLTVLNASSRATGLPKQSHIWIGQCLGVALMVVVALLAAAGLHAVPLKWVGLLGLIPLTRGSVLLITTTIHARRGGHSAPPVVATGWRHVTAVTFANGGDNIAAYTAAFRIMGLTDTIVTIAVFAAGIAVWCLAASLLVSHQRLIGLLQRYSRWVIPVIFIALGVYILQRSGLLTAVG